MGWFLSAYIADVMIHGMPLYGPIKRLFPMKTGESCLAVLRNGQQPYSCTQVDEAKKEEGTIKGCKKNEFEYLINYSEAEAKIRLSR